MAVSVGCINVVLAFPVGRVRLCGELPEERAEYPHRLHPLHVHLRCHCRAAFQGQVLLLHGRVQRPGEGLQVESVTTHTSAAPPVGVKWYSPPLTLREEKAVKQKRL